MINNVWCNCTIGNWYNRSKPVRMLAFLIIGSPITENVLVCDAITLSRFIPVIDTVHDYRELEYQWRPTHAILVVDSVIVSLSRYPTL